MALEHAKPGQVVDLGTAGAEGTTALVKTEQFEAIRLVVREGGRIPPHEVSGDLTLQCLEGRVALTVAGSASELAAGQWVYLAGGVEHAVEGIEDAVLLLTIVFDYPGGTVGRAAGEGGT